VGILVVCLLEHLGEHAEHVADPADADQYTVR
jgi:hypothetical protein